MDAESIRRQFASTVDKPAPLPAHSISLSAVWLSEINELQARAVDKNVLRLLSDISPSTCRRVIDSGFENRENPDPQTAITNAITEIVLDDPGVMEQIIGNTKRTLSELPQPSFLRVAGVICVQDMQEHEKNPGPRAYLTGSHYNYSPVPPQSLRKAGTIVAPDEGAMSAAERVKALRGNSGDGYPGKRTR